MNTYINEITSIRQPQGDNKIPAGAICGNGDLAVIFGREGDDLLLHISKCDFWKMAEYSDGGIKTVGAMRIGGVSLEDFHLVQYMREGRIECSFGGVSCNLFVSPDNIIFVSLTAGGDKPFPTLDIELPDTCGSESFTYSEKGLKWYMRKFGGRGVKQETAAALCCRRFPARLMEEAKTVSWCVSVVTSFDNRSYQAQAIKLAAEADYDKSLKATAAFWENFFSKSQVTLFDKALERQYNGSLYLLGCCMGNPNFPPGLFGNFITDDFYPWHGDYHLNYNFEAPYYCVFSSNHPELARGYIKPLEDIIPDGKRYASDLLACKGIYLPVGIGPQGIDLSAKKGALEGGILFLGQKSNAAYAAVIPVMEWYSGCDRDRAAKRLYPYLKEVGEFWESYLVKENGKYVIKKDAIHEVPYFDVEHFKENKYKKEINAQNNILSLGLVRMVFKCLIDMSREMDIDREKVPLWQDILTCLSPYPTFIKKGKRCFRYTEKGISWVKRNSLAIQHIYPASQIGLSSHKKTLKIARNTYFANDRRLDDNGSCSYLPCGARLGVDPDYLLKGLKKNMEKFLLPNMLFRHSGGCLEHLSTVPSTINEMLMQSFEGVIRIFPCWNKDNSASFKNLRADGGFLVSAAVKKGKITTLKIKSLMGKRCVISLPEGVKFSLTTASGEKVKFKKTDKTAEFNTKIGEEYIII